MKDLGVSHHGMPVEATSKSSSKSYPTVTIDHKAGIFKNKKVGHKGHMKVRYNVVGQRSYRNGDGHTDIELTHAEDAEGAKS